MDKSNGSSIRDRAGSAWAARAFGGADMDLSTISPVTEVGSHTGLAFVPAAPVERFSSERPVFYPETDEEADLWPIDSLFGNYDASKREVTIFHEQICTYAPGLGVSAPALESVVRLHEFAHGLVHLGTDPEEIGKLAIDERQHGKTDWDTFIAERTAIFEQFNEATHELLAQAITWRAIGNSGNLKKAFTALMRRQRSVYRLAPDVLSGAECVSWSSILDALRDPETAETLRPDQVADQIVEALSLEFWKKLYAASGGA